MRDSNWEKLVRAAQACVEDYGKQLSEINAKLDKICAMLERGNPTKPEPPSVTPQYAGKPLLTKKEVKALTTLSASHIDRLEKAGDFPERIRLTDHARGRCAYNADEVHEFIAKRRNLKEAA